MDELGALEVEGRHWISNAQMDIDDPKLSPKSIVYSHLFVDLDGCYSAI